MRAKCYDKMDDLDHAERDYRKALELDPVAPCAHYFLGLILESSDRLEEAMQVYQIAKRLGIDLKYICPRLRALSKT